jgi:hypothetical protein
LSLIRPAASNQWPGALNANEVKVIPNYPANNLLFDNLAIFLYSYSNQPGHPNQQHRIDVKSWLLF